MKTLNNHFGKRENVTGCGNSGETERHKKNFQARKSQSRMREEAGFGENMGSVCVELKENKADNPRWINDSGRREFQTRVELLQWPHGIFTSQLLLLSICSSCNHLKAVAQTKD